MKTHAHTCFVQSLLASGALLAAATLFFSPATAFAQDVKFTDPVARTSLLKPPAFAEEMTEDNLDYVPDLPTYAYMIIQQTIDESGTVTNPGRLAWSSDPEMNKAFPIKSRNIKFEPAERDGTPALCVAYFALIYNPANAPETGPDAVPRLLNVTLTLVNTDDLLNANGGKTAGATTKTVVWVKANIDANGVITKCILDKDSAWATPLQDIIYKSVSQWMFAPARHDGQFVSAEVRIPVRLTTTAARTSSSQNGKRVLSPKGGTYAPAGQAAAAPAYSAFSSRQTTPSAYMPARDADITQLPTYVVTGTRVLPPPESWYYAKLPGIEVLSNASKGETRHFLDDFQRLQIALRIVWPALMDAKARMSTLIVLCGKNGTYNTLKPTRNTSRNSLALSNNFLAEDSERTAIVMDYTWYNSSARANQVITDPYRLFYRNYAIFLIRRSNEGRQVPQWFEAGLSYLISTIDFNNKWIQFAQISKDLFIAPGFNPYMRTAGSGQSSLYFLPMEDIFTNNRRVNARTWGAQSYEFVHMCLYGKQGTYQKPFAQFLQIATERAVTEDDFKKCFGCSYTDMQLELRNYLDYMDYKSQLFTPKKGSAGMPQPSPVDVRDATQGEIGRIKGEVFRLGGSPGEASNAEIGAYMRGEKDPALLASLGLAEHEAKREDRAVRFLEAAAKGNVERPYAYLTLAQIRFRQETSGADEVQLDASQVASVLDPLSVALKQQPPMPDTYALIGNVWLDSATPPTQDQMSVVLQGVRQFPANANLVYSAASLYAKYGDAATTANLIKLGRQIRNQPQSMQDKFDALQSSLNPPAASK